MPRKRLHTLVDRYLVEDGRRFRMKHFDPGDTAGIRPEKEDAANMLKEGVARLGELQEKLYAQDRWGVLLIFQAMDAAGKDGVIEHVMSGINPQGCDVHSFKQPSSEELDHDFLWRTAVRLPERGRIGIFNRSYYEEVLIVRVHRHVLDEEKLPPEVISGRIWKERFEDIAGFERYFARNGFVIRKFFLHVSKQEQARRFRKRLEHPHKFWKFSLGDVRERQHWASYMAAYEEAIRHTATPEAPWVVVPADHKWFTRLVVAQTIVSALEGLDLAYPKVTAAKRRELKEGRALLGR
jgi:PPK2 family polyphosphate:nucleotide phosphotransferase